MKYLSIILLFISISVHAEERAGLALGWGKVEGDSVRTLGLDYQFLVDTTTIGKGSFKIGPGLRYTRIVADQFSIYKDEEVLKDVRVNAFNLAFYSEYDINNFAFGFNIDVFGFSTGKSSDIKKSDDDTEPNSSNLLLGGNNDKGTLNSEFWGGYRYKKWIFRGGLSHLVMQYTGSNPKDDKRQRFFNTFFLSAGWNY